MNSEIKAKLQEAFKNPSQKFAFFSGQNDPDFGRLFDKDQWDWTPQECLTVEPWHWHEHTVALPFGCRSVQNADGNETAAPFITDPARVAKVNTPDPVEGRTGLIIEEIENILLEVDDDVLIRLPVIDSPLRIAELLWQKDAFHQALHSHPQQMHDLLQKITDFTIAYVQEIQGILGDRLNPASYPEIWCPPHGCYIADDGHSLISSDMHLEYSVPYINKIVDACGPLHYHFDSLTNDYFENVRQINNIRSLSWSVAADDESEAIIKEFSGQCVLCPSIDSDSHKASDGGAGFVDESQLVTHLLETMQEDTTLYFAVQPELQEKRNVMKKIYDQFVSLGYAPTGD